MPVDVWRGMNEGLASLDKTFDAIEARRMRDMEMARQARIDALQEPIFRAQGEGATLDLAEKRRKISDLRAYDAARKELEANPGTVPTVTERDNPAYLPPREQMGPSLPRTMDVGEGQPVSVDAGMPKFPAQGLPTMEVAGTRPLNPAEMAFKRMTLALQHGQPVSDIGATYDLAEKLGADNPITKFAKGMKTLKDAGLSAADRKKMAPMIAQQTGNDPKMVTQLDFTPQGTMMLAPNGSTYLVDNEGMFLHEFKQVEPKSPTEWEIRARAAQGDPLSVKILKDKKAEGESTGPPYVPGSATGTPGERNEQALKGLSQGDAATVKGLADYRIPLPSGFALKTPWGQRLLGAVTSYDPTFDASQYNVRYRLRTDFNSGKAAINIRGLNTAISHFETLDKKAKELGNSWSPAWNSVANMMATATGDPRVKGFGMAATAVESELAAVFKGMGATDQEIKAWRANLDAAGSPRQLKEAIDTGVELLGGRLQALNSQYEVGMGKPKDFHFLSEKSRAILKKLGADVDAIDSVAKEKQGAIASPGVTRVRRYNPATGQLEDAK